MPCYPSAKCQVTGGFQLLGFSDEPVDLQEDVGNKQELQGEKADSGCGQLFPGPDCQILTRTMKPETIT